MARQLKGSNAVPAWVLAENATMRLPHRRAPAVVRAERGTVLVTRSGDGEDHVLQPGDELVVPPRGVTVAWALTDAAISLRDAPAPGPHKAEGR